MARRGRPRKDLTPLDKEKMQLADEIVSQLRYTTKLTKEQIEALQNTLDTTFKHYDLERQENISEDEYTIQDINHRALQDFIQSKRSEAKSATTIYNYSNELGKLFTVINKDYRKITPQEIREYMEYRREHDGVAATTVHNIRMYLMSFYKWAVTDERLIRNPMDKIGVVKVEKKVVETFTDEEVEMLRCACKNERDLAMVDLLSSSGMRVSELCNLNISDVDFETGEIKVFGKGKKERICFMTGRAKIHLKWYIQSRVDSNPALFVTIKKPYSRLTKNGVEYALKELGKESGVNIKGRIYPHKFRSTLATNMLNKGADLSIIQNTLGHADPSTTMQVYCRMETDTIKSAHRKYVN